MVLLVIIPFPPFHNEKVSLYLAVAAMASLTLSCKKDSDTATPAPATKTALLTAKSWKVTDLKIGGVSLFSSLPSCTKDDLIKFNTNKTAVFDEGATKCSSSDPQTANGSWDFTTNETKLKITDPDGTVIEGTIGTLNSTTLIFSDPNYLGSGQAAEATYTAQ